METITTKLNLSQRYRKSLEASWKEGIPASIMIAITDYYIIPLGLLLGASVVQIGMLVAIPHLLGAISQLFAVFLLKRVGSRKRFIVIGALLQAVFLIPIAFLPLLAIKYKVVFFILLVAIFRIMGNLIGTVWGSLMSDYLPADQRGSYFGWRSRISGLAGIFGLISGGITLFLLKFYSPSAGFFIVFLLIAIARFFSVYLLTKLEDIPLSHTKESDFTFFQFISRFRQSNFVKFIFYVSSLMLATHLSAPFFSVYMLRDLQLNYIQYTSVHLAAVLAGLFAFPIWGWHADHVGNARVLKLTSFLIPFIPLFWVFTKNIYLLLLVELFAGFVWGGFNLCSVNFIFDAVSQEKRVRCLSYFNLINGMAIFIGANLGGFLAHNLPPLRGFQLCSLFLVSSILRFVAHFFLSGKFNEVRESAKKTSGLRLFFSVAGIRPLFGRTREWIVFPKSEIRD